MWIMSLPSAWYNGEEMKKLILIFLLLSACAPTRSFVFQNPQNGNVVDCEMQAQMSTPPAGYSMASSVSRGISLGLRTAKCEENMLKAGWERLE